MTSTEGLLKISDITRITGVSAQTVHYYLRENLLTPPVKTARNMAYYQPVVADEIRLIKELQQKRYLPLVIIKKILEAGRSGQDVDHIKEMQYLYEFVFDGREGKMPARLSRKELIASSGLTGTIVRELNSIGLLMPSDKEKNLYNEADVRIARMLKKLLDLGLTPADLIIYSRYMETIRGEVQTIRNKMMKCIHDGVISLPDLINITEKLKTELDKKTFRQVLLEAYQDSL